MRKVLILLLLLAPLFAIEFISMDAYSDDNFRAVAVYVSDSNVYVLDDKGDYIYTFERNLDFVRKTQGETYTIGSPEDLWGEGDYIFILDGNGIIGYDTDKKDTFCEGRSDSYGPDDGVSLVVHSNKIYISDSDGNKVIVVRFVEDSELFVLDSVLSYSAIGEGYAALSSPKGLYWYDGNLYIADYGKNRVLVVDENLSQVDYYGLLKGHVRLNKPREVAVDEDYVYVVDNGGDRLKVLRKSTGIEIANFSADDLGVETFRDLFVYDDDLYVVDGYSVYRFRISRTTGLTQVEVEDVKERAHSYVDRVCELENASDLLEIEHDFLCDEYISDIEVCDQKFEDEDYDNAFTCYSDLHQDAMGYESRLASKMKRIVSSRLDGYEERMDDLREEASASVNAQLDTVEYRIRKVREWIEEYNFEKVPQYMNEIDRILSILEGTQENIEEVEEEVASEYESLLSDLKDEYSEYKYNFTVYHIETEDLDGLINQAEEALDRGDLENVSDLIGRASARLQYYKARLEIKKKKVENALQTIEVAKDELDKVRGSSFLWISVDTSELEILLNDAQETLYVDPDVAKAKAEKVIVESQKMRKRFNENMVATIGGIIVILLLIAVIALVGAGVYLLRRKR